MSIYKDYDVCTCINDTVMPVNKINTEPLTFHEARRLRDKCNSGNTATKAVIRPTEMFTVLMQPRTQFSVLLLRMFVGSNPNASAKEYANKFKRRTS